MKRRRLQVCVIGLGHFGGALARALARHCDVLALDVQPARVQALTDRVQRALCLDARDASALASVVTPDFDQAVVSIGESLEASILCTLHLRRIGVPVIRAKADSADHAEVLKAVGATSTIFPEEETAERLAVQIAHPNLLDFIPLSEDYRVIDLVPGPALLQQALVDLRLRARFEVFVLAVRKPSGQRFLFLPGPDYVVTPGDVLVVIGREDRLLALEETGGVAGRRRSQPPPPPER